MNTTIPYAERLNRECRCKTLCQETLEKKLKGIRELRPNLFSETTTYLDIADFRKISSLITQLEKIISHKTYRKRITGKENAPSTAGVLMGYDFHLTDEGPRLIEINTNAGGIYLNLILAQSQIQCCAGMNLFFDEKKNLTSLEHTLVEMFRQEWKMAGHNTPLRSVAIVDENPAGQYLYPEFQLFRDLLIQHGIEAFVLDPEELKNFPGIDLIYNRLTDFSLSLEKHSHIKKAWIEGTCVLTPSPDHHALFANKKNLTLLTDTTFLKDIGLNQDEISLITSMIPRTRNVRETDGETLWNERKTLFFKPVDGFGSKAAYRGDKITKKVWDEVLLGDYVAQDVIPAGKRVIADREVALKADIRVYTYDGQILLLAARLYDGQTTNFRTAGGGFSPVFVVSGKEA